MNSTKGRGFFITGQFHDRRNQVGLVALHDSLLGAQAPPEVRVGEARHQVPGRIDILVIVGNDSINASQADGLIEFARGRLVAQVGGQKALVLDDPTVEIDQVKASVGTHRSVHRPEALVRTGKKLALLPDRIGISLVEVFIGQGKGFLGKKGAHRIGAGRHRKDGALPFLAIGPVTVYRQTADGGHAGDAPVLEYSTWLVVAVEGGVWPDPIDPVGRSRDRASLARPLPIVGRPVDLEPLAVGIEVESSVGVRPHAPLPPAPGRHLDDLPPPPGQLAAGLRVVHPVVQGKVKGVLGMLDVTVSRGCEVHELGLLVASEIPVLVLAEPQGTRLDHEDPAIDEGKAAHVDHVVDEGSRLVHSSVAICIL